MSLALAVRFRLLHRPLEPALTDPLIAPLSLLPPSKWVKDQQHKVWSNRIKFSDLVYEVGEQSPAGTSAGAAQDSSAKTRGSDPRHRERARPRHDHR